MLPTITTGVTRVDEMFTGPVRADANYARGGGGWKKVHGSNDSRNTSEVPDR